MPEFTATAERASFAPLLRAPARQTLGALLGAEFSPFELPDACEYFVASAKEHRARDGQARIATWNVRWFPDSVHSPSANDPGTDVVWLSCAMTALDAPVIAVQEFRRHARGEEKSRELIELLNRRTDGDWRLELDRCPDPPGDNVSHVGFLYDARRVTGSDFRHVDELNPKGGCRDGLHPGFAGYFRFPGGFDVTLVSVHLMWGDDANGHELRRRAWSAFRASDPGRLLKPGDDDLVILGDFNTNGCRDCDEPLDPASEVRETASEAARLWPRLSLVDNDLACTEYDEGTPLPLDHFLVTTSTKELSKDARVTVAGICEKLGCKPQGGANLFHSKLSDHCPLVLKFIDRDWD